MSRKAFACCCRSFARCSARAMTPARAMKRLGGGCWSAIVRRARASLAGSPFLLTVHALVPLHPLRMTVGVVRNGRRS
jgi:hypothetical protein